MSAKLLHSLTDESSDLPKHNGCMNGVLQFFGRHHFLTIRRIHKRLPPAGSSIHEETEESGVVQKEEDSKKVVKEKRRLSSESSRISFSSSSCSSTISSLEHSKLETSSLNQETPFSTNQPNTPFQPERRSLDLRDVVKESIHKEPKALSVRTSKEERIGHAAKHVDSPRPLPISNSFKSRGSAFNEPSKLLLKLQQVQCHNEFKDARFSYDGRALPDKFKSTMKIKELPRLSLDSRAGSVKGSGPEFSSRYLKGNCAESGDACKIQDTQLESGGGKRQSSLIAKLMGLEALPDSMSSSVSEMSEGRDFDSLSRSTRISEKDILSPKTRNVDSGMKVTSRIPLEPAPWKQTHEKQHPKRTPLSNGSLINPSHSVYGEIEKRLAELEFKRSGKDLRALKQILEAMQKTKAMFEVKHEDEFSDSVFQTRNATSSSSSLDKFAKQIDPSDYRSTHYSKGSGSPKALRSPIVIMKPAKITPHPSNSASSISSIESMPSLRKLQTINSMGSRKCSGEKQMEKVRIRRKIPKRDTSSQPRRPSDKITSGRSLRPTQSSKIRQQTSSENASSNRGKTSGSVSPRLQNRKIGLERQPQPPNPSSELSRNRRLSSMPPSELNLHGKKLRPQAPIPQQANGQMRNDAKYSSYGEDTASLHSESSTTIISQFDLEVTSTGRSGEMNETFLADGQDHQKEGGMFREGKSMAVLATPTPEQPSPISVLDATFYGDESPSPVKKTSSAFQDDETLNSDESGWAPEPLSPSPDRRTPDIMCNIDPEREESIKQFIQRLNQLNFPGGEPATNSPAPFPDANWKHSYICEILLASGLLIREDDPISLMANRPSGHLINPSLFPVLEETRTRTELPRHGSLRYGEKMKRKLIFDAIDEILVRKFSQPSSTDPWFLTKEESGTLQGEHLLKELCAEVDQLQSTSSNCNLEDEDDSLRTILWDDLRQQSQKWTDFRGEMPGLVLDIERLVFKDLINEVVGGELSSVPEKFGEHCRKVLFK